MVGCETTSSDPELRQKGLVSAKSSLELGKSKSKSKGTVEAPDEINGAVIWLRVLGASRGSDFSNTDTSTPQSRSRRTG